MNVYQVLRNHCLYRKRLPLVTYPLCFLADFSLEFIALVYVNFYKSTGTAFMVTYRFAVPSTKLH